MMHHLEDNIKIFKSKYIVTEKNVHVIDVVYLKWVNWPVLVVWELSTKFHHTNGFCRVFLGLREVEDGKQGLTPGATFPLCYPRGQYLPSWQKTKVPSPLFIHSRDNIRPIATNPTACPPFIVGINSNSLSSIYCGD